MYPSTCGWIVAECRDFRTERYSVISGIFSAWAIFTCTGMACGAPPAAGSPAEVLPHPDASARAPITISACAPRLKRLFLTTWKQSMVEPNPGGNPYSLQYDCTDTKIPAHRLLMDKRPEREFRYFCRGRMLRPSLARCWPHASLSQRAFQPAQYKSRVSIVFPDSPNCSTSNRSYRSNTLPGNNLLVNTRTPPNARPKTTAITIKTPVPTKIRYRTTPNGRSVAVWLGSFQVTCVW